MCVLVADVRGSGGSLNATYGLYNGYGLRGFFTADGLTLKIRLRMFVPGKLAAYN